MIICLFYAVENNLIFSFIEVVRNTNKMSQGWTPLDGIRGILALAVLGIHIPLKNEFTRNVKNGIGVIIGPVDVFLLLSGLACGRGYANKPWSIRAIVLFYQKRLRRILPVYLFAISIMRIFDHQTNVSKYLSPVLYVSPICDNRV